MARNRVFISYSREDKKVLQALQKMLAPLIRADGLVVWDDTRIKAGDRWRLEIDSALQECAVAVLLVSPSFLASKFISEVELPALLNAAESSQLKVCWVLVSACLYQANPNLSKFQAAHDPAEPLDSLTKSKKNLVLVDIARTIEEQYKSVLEGQKTDGADAPAMAPKNLRNGFHPDRAPSQVLSSDQSDVSPPSVAPGNISGPGHLSLVDKLTSSVAKDRKPLSSAEKKTLIGMFVEENDFTEEEVKMPPQEMTRLQVSEIYQNSTNAVIHYLKSIEEKQANFLYRSPRSADPRTEEIVALLKKMQHQVLLVATVAQVHSPDRYEIYRFESKFLLASIKNLKAILLNLNKHLVGGKRPPDDIQSQMANEFENLVFGAGRTLLLMHELTEPTKNALMQ